MARKPLEIYFFGSINGGTQDIDAYYRPMIRRLERFGRVLSKDIFFKEEIVQGIEHGTSDREIFKRDTRLIRRADVLVGEVTTPSTGVGYELGLAESLKTPILCLHRSTGRPLTPMVGGNEYLTVRHYTHLPAAYAHMTTFFKTIRSKR